MNAQVEFPAATDSGPELSVLSWCAGEIRQSLQAAGEALRRQLQAGPDDASALRAAGIALHQAHGALSVVGLSGVQVLTAEGERLLDAFGSGSVELTESRASAFERACTALAEYLDGLLAGDRHQPLYLFPYYRDLAFARGAERVSPSDLLALRPNGLPALDPARHSDASALAAARAAFELGLLRLLRNPEDRQALLAMHGAVDTVLHSPRGRAQAPFWQAALACFEAWRDGALSLDVNGKRLLARINLQIRHTQADGAPVAERLLSETLFVLAGARGGSPLVRSLCEAWGLADAIPDDYETPRYGLIDATVRDAAREALARLRKAWAVLAGGPAAASERLQASQAFVDAAASLPFDGLRDFGGAMLELAHAVASPQRETDDTLGLEAATALLFVEQMFERGLERAGELDARVGELAQRLHGAAAGEGELGPVPDWLLALGHAAQERSTLAAFVAETRTTLQSIEQVLDIYFRDASQCDGLPAAALQLRQVGGALRMIGEHRAGDDAIELAERVASFAAAAEAAASDNGNSSEPAHAELEALATKLGALGFFVDGLLAPGRGSPNLAGEAVEPDRAVEPDPGVGSDADVGSDAEVGSDADVQTGSAVEPGPAAAPTEAGRSGEAPAAVVGDAPSVASTSSQAQAPANASPEVPADDAADAELLEIFLGEAAEVLDAIAQAVGSLRDTCDDKDALTAIRRGFHTLKGSGRMVGLNRFGEAAWAMEQLLNLWLAEARSVEPGLLDLIELAAARFGGWIAMFGERAQTTIDPEPVIAAARSVREGGAAESALATLLAAGASVAEVGQETPAPEAADAAVREAPGSAPPVTLDEAFDFQNVASDADGSDLPENAAGFDDGVADDPAVAGFDEAREPDDALAIDEARAADDARVRNDVRTDADPEIEGGSSAGDVAAEASFESIDIDSPTGEAAPTTDAASLETSAEGPIAATAEDSIEATTEDSIEATTEDSIESSFGIAIEASSDESVEATIEAPIEATSEELLGEDARDNELSGEVEVGALRLSRPLYDIFVAESDQLLATLRGDFEAWTATPERGATEVAQRAMHSLKGSSAVVSLFAVQTIAEQLEAFLLRQRVSGRGVSPQDLKDYADGIDCLGGMLRRFADGTMPQDEPGVLAVATQLAARWDTQRARRAPVVETGELDADLLPLFLEEATDILPQIGENLRGWHARPGDRALQQLVMRQLHTVKGSARMAGAMVLGQRVHEMETRVEATSGLSVVPATLIEELIADHDDVVEMFEAIRDPQAREAASARSNAAPLDTDDARAHAFEAGDALLSGESRDVDRGGATAGASFDPASQPAGTGAFRAPSADASQMPGPAASPAAEADGSPAHEASASEAGRANAPVGIAATQLAALHPDHAGGEAARAGAVTAADGTGVAGTSPVAPVSAGSSLVRVRADLLERVVNESGEVSIARSRLDNELSQLRQALQELTENVGRLRTQLREIEIQSETQVQARIAHQRDNEADFDPLEFDRYTRFQELTRMLAESVNDVATVQQNAMRSLDGAAQDMIRQGQVLRELQQNLMRMRMVQFGTISDRLYRVVRQAAKELGKRVSMDMRGTSVEVDRGVLERMAAPIEHLLRNAVAHGIEPPAARSAAGKAEAGEIRLEVRQEGNEVVLVFADDGAGLDTARIVARGRRNGLVAGDADVSDRDAAALIFMPGFSTAESIDEISGRGVGLDVVRAEVEALGGRIDTDWTPGGGTRFTVHLPLTLAIAQVVLVSAGSQRYAIPASSVEQVLQLKPPQLAEAYTHGRVVWQGSELPIRFLGTIVGLQEAKPIAQHRSPVVVIRSGNQRIAVHADSVSPTQEVVVKNVGPQVARVPGVGGATVLGNGEIVLILNAVRLAQAMFGDDGLARGTPSDTIAALADVPPTVMVVDDSLTVRKVTQRLLAREGYDVMLAKDGVDALRQLQDRRPDLMLVDIEMPRMDGFDLTRNLRGDERYRDIPVVMITSRTADKHRNYAMSLGVDVFLGKPYRDDELLQHVAAFTRERTTAAS